MAKSERISLRGIGREISDVVRKLKTARRHADSSQYAHLDNLEKQLTGLQGTLEAMCIRIYGVWPEPYAGTPPAAKPKAAPSRKRGARRARSKKRR